MLRSVLYVRFVALFLFVLGATSPTVTEAAVIGFNFNASLQSGTLAGTMFPGTGSYDTAGISGVGEEFVTLTSLDFTLIGIPFTRADIKQGGQAVLENGALSYFTAAFFPPPPDNSPVTDIAFGFGGPGIIGYVAPPEQFGDGVYTLSETSIPEPASVSIFGMGLLMSALIACTAQSLTRRHPR